MEIKINLEDVFVSDHDETLASIVRDEITQAVRAEVRRIARDAIKSQAARLQALITERIRKVTPERLEELLAALRKK